MSERSIQQSRPGIPGIPLRWTLTVLAVAMALICAAVFKLLIDARANARARASTEIGNLSAAITRDVARNIDLYALSMQGVLEGMRNPAVMMAPKPLRQLILFDRAASAPFLGALVVLDERGSVAIDSGDATPWGTTYADLDYFRYHAEHADPGLYVGRPMRSKADGGMTVALSRRYNKPDGSFGGVVVGSLRLDYFHQLFSRLNLGSRGAVSLFRTDGTVLMREPYDPDLIGRQYGSLMLADRLAKAREGEYEAKALVDGVVRLYHYQQVGDFPLVQFVALSVDEIDADWRAKAIWASAVMGACCGIVALLGLALRRELQRRTDAEAELVALSEEDRLTGLANRRRFDGALAAEWRRAARLGGSLSLLMIDADLFEGFNDALGPLAGDHALAALGRCLAGWAQRPGDVAARYGGAGFAMILPHAVGPEAMQLAELIRRDVLELGIDHPASVWRRLSVSIGVATARTGPDASPADLVADAEAALHASKAAGRNRSTPYAPASDPTETDEGSYAVRTGAGRPDAGASTVAPNTSSNEARSAASTSAMAAG